MHSTEPGSRLRILLIAAVFVAVLVAIYHTLFSHYGAIDVGKRGLYARPIPQLKSIDNLFRSAAQRGNIAVVCTTVSPDFDEFFLAPFYFSGSYVAYPRRVFVAPSGTAINEAKDFTNLNWRPDRAFIESNDIAMIIRVTPRPGMQPNIEFAESRTYLEWIEKEAR